MSTERPPTPLPPIVKHVRHVLAGKNREQRNLRLGDVPDALRSRVRAAVIANWAKCARRK